MNLDPSSTAVLALHFQRDVVAPEGALSAELAPQVGARGVIPRTAELLAAARKAGVRVVYVRVAFAPGHEGLDTSVPLFAACAELDALVAGTPGAEIVAPLAPAEGEAVVEHGWGSSGFVGGELERLVAAAGIETVLLAGVSTDVIVDGTARDASHRGLRTFVVEDCCAAADPAVHETFVATLGLITHGVVQSADVVAELGGG
jgi:nicotinamidase-related amidase